MRGRLLTVSTFLEALSCAPTRTGTGIGTVSFGDSDSVMISGDSHADIYYNPASYTDLGTKSDADGSNPYSTIISGGGTYTAWMLVNDVQNLQAINTNLIGKYALGKNIDASGTVSWNSGAGFAPVGDETFAFTGNFDGLGHTINSLTINRPTTDSVGLFGKLDSAGSIANVGLVGGSVSGRERSAP